MTASRLEWAKALRSAIASGLALMVLSAIPTQTVAGEPQRPCQFTRGQARAEYRPGASREWAPAIFHGVLLGRATEAEVLAALGAPTRREPFAKDEEWLHYDRWDRESVAGNLVVKLYHGTAVTVWLELGSHRLDVNQAIALYGRDYLVATYRFANCLGEGDVAPVYEASSGSMCRVEYRSQGISMHVASDGYVRSIHFRSSPVGRERSVCEGTQELHRDGGESPAGQGSVH